MLLTDWTHTGESMRVYEAFPSSAEVNHCFFIFTDALYSHFFFNNNNIQNATLKLPDNLRSYESKLKIYSMLYRFSHILLHTIGLVLKNTRF